MNVKWFRRFRHCFICIFDSHLARRFILLIACSLPLTSGIAADEIDVWVGTSKIGIYHLKLDTERGVLTNPTRASDIKGAGFLALHPTEPILYSTNREGPGGVTAFAIGSNPKIGLRAETRDSKNPGTNQLTLLNTLSTGDGGAACVSVDKTGRVLMSAQYGGGSVSTYLLDSDGRLDKRVDTIEHGQGSGVFAKRQDESHPHWVGTSPDNRFLMVPDLGQDRVVVYELNAENARLKLHSKLVVPPGSGPRHMKFHDNGKYLYVLNELSLTVSVFEYDATSGVAKNIQLIETLPRDLKDKHLNSAAEIRIHPNGKFVYTSNRGHDSITVFSVDPNTGKLAFVEREHIRGSIPRNFNIEPSGKWLIAAGQNSNTLALFEIDPTSGELVFSRKIVNVPAPICVLFESE